MEELIIDSLIDIGIILYEVEFFFHKLREKLKSHWEKSPCELKLEAHLKEFRNFCKMFSDKDISAELQVKCFLLKVISNFFKKKLFIDQLATKEKLKLLRQRRTLNFSTPIGTMETFVDEYIETSEEHEEDIDFEKFWCSQISKEEQNFYIKISETAKIDFNQKEDEILEKIGIINEEVSIELKKLEEDENNFQIDVSSLVSQLTKEERNQFLIQLLETKTNWMELFLEKKRLQEIGISEEIRTNESELVSILKYLSPKYLLI